MNNLLLNPQSVHEPLGLYSHAMKVESDCEWLVVAGQLGVDSTGKVVSGFREQAEQALSNILACLEANAMSKEDLVKLSIFSTVPGCVGDVQAARRKILGDSVVPPSTLLIVAGLASPEFLVEIEAFAARK
ncbi:MAG: RidA family protein [Pseudomonadota bacterium]